MKNRTTETPQLSLWAWRIIVNEFESKLENLRELHSLYTDKGNEEKLKNTERDIRNVEMVINELYGYGPEEE